MDVKIRTGKAADRGGWLLMPLRENVPDPGDGEWQILIRQLLVLIIIAGIVDKK